MEITSKEIVVPIKYNGVEGELKIKPLSVREVIKLVKLINSSKPEAIEEFVDLFVSKIISAPFEKEKIYDIPFADLVKLFNYTIQQQTASEEEFKKK